MRDIYRRNPDRFRLFCPDETNSNRLGAVFEVSDRAFAERVTEDDVALSRNGRVMEVLSEHNCHGWLEGYILTGRHGWFATYEAFAMVSACRPSSSKWLRSRTPVLAGQRTEPQHPSHVDGLAQRSQRVQPPGTGVDPERHHAARQRGKGVPATRRQHTALRRRPLPSLSVYVNLVVIDKQPSSSGSRSTTRSPTAHEVQASGSGPEPTTAPDPDIVLACAGDVVTMETVAAASILRDGCPSCVREWSTSST